MKYVPQKCMSKELKELEEKYYQYIAIDEYTRQRVLWASKEHRTYASTQFLEIIIKKFKYKIECIQTDNGDRKVQMKNTRNFRHCRANISYLVHKTLYLSIKCDICLTNLQN